MRLPRLRERVELVSLAAYTGAVSGEGWSGPPVKLLAVRWRSLLPVSRLEVHLVDGAHSRRRSGLRLDSCRTYGARSGTVLIPHRLVEEVRGDGEHTLKVFAQDILGWSR